MSNDNIEEEVINKIRKLKFWNSPTRFEILEGGRTNINVRITDRGQDFVARVGKDIPIHGILRFNELAINQAANLAGVAPRVVHSENNIQIFEFIDGKTLSEQDIQDPKTLEDVTNFLRKTHSEVQKHLRGPILSFWVFHIIRHYANILTEQKSNYAPQLVQLMKDAELLESLVGPIELVLGHNDLIPENFILDDRQLWLIDWEYGGFNSPLFDLGGLSTNCQISQEFEQRMLEIYFEKPPSDEQFQSFTAIKCASLLRETMWSMVSEITSDIDFDYQSYTELNFARYQKAKELSGY